MSLHLIETKHYVRVTNLLGASFMGWYTQTTIATYSLDRYSIEYLRAAPPRRRMLDEQPTPVDAIADLCYELVYAQYGVGDDPSHYTQMQADAAVYAMRDTLEIILENLGHKLLEPLTPDGQVMLNDYRRKQVMRMQAAAIMLERREAEKSQS